MTQTKVGPKLDIGVSLSAAVAAHRRFAETVEAVASEVVDDAHWSDADVHFVEAGAVARRDLSGVVLAVGSATGAEAYRLALRSGAAGLLDWWSSPEEVSAAIHAAREGYCVVPQGVSVALGERLDEPPLGLELSEDQLSLLQSVAEGLTVEELAAERRMSERHLRRHLRVIWDMLGASGRATGLVRATRWGLVS